MVPHARLGQGTRFVSEDWRVSSGLSAAGFQDMSPVRAHKGTGRGDAVSGINGADSANVCGLHHRCVPGERGAEAWSAVFFGMALGRWVVLVVVAHRPGRRLCPLMTNRIGSPCQDARKGRCRQRHGLTGMAVVATPEYERDFEVEGGGKRS